MQKKVVFKDKDWSIGHLENIFYLLQLILLLAVPHNFDNPDSNKTQLIMQVLQLSDAQISILPAEQQASILELKRQIGERSILHGWMLY